MCCVYLMTKLISLNILIYSRDKNKNHNWGFYLRFFKQQTSILYLTFVKKFTLTWYQMRIYVNHNRVGAI